MLGIIIMLSVFYIMAALGMMALTGAFGAPKLAIVLLSTLWPFGLAWLGFMLVCIAFRDMVEKRR